MRIAACMVLFSMACAPREPIGQRTDAVSPFSVTRAAEFDPDTRFPFRATTGQQVSARLAVRGTNAVVSWNDDRQDPPYLKSVFTVRFETDGGRVTDTVLSVPSLAVRYSNELDLALTGGDALLSFESGEIAQLKESGLPRTVHPVSSGHRLVAAANETFVILANGADLELARFSLDGGGRTAIASWSGVDTRELHFTGAASTSEVLVVFRALATDGGTPELQGALVSMRDGGAGLPFTLAPSQGELLSAPTVSSDGTDFLVGWRRDRTELDGGLVPTVEFAAVSGLGVVGTPFSPNDGVDEPRVCFDGTSFRVSYREPLSCCSARLFAATAVPSSGTFVSTTRLVEDWVFGSQLACGSSGAAVVWSQWNYVNAGNAAVVMQWLQPDNTPSGTSFPVSLTGERQGVLSATPSWISFETPRATFLTPGEGTPDASIPLDQSTIVAGRQADELGLFYGTNPDVVFERRSASGVPQGTITFTTSAPGFVSRALATAGDAWEGAWAWNDELYSARFERDGGSSRQLVSSSSPVGSPALAVNGFGEVLVAWEDRPGQVVNWKRVDGGAPQSMTGVYYSQPTVGGVRDRWLVAWVGRNGVGIVGTWVEREGVSDGGLLQLSRPGPEASPAIACGPRQCLLTWVRGTTSWDVMGMLIEDDGAMGEPFVIFNGPDAELNPRPVFLADGAWLLAYDVFEPAIGTRRVRVAKLIELVDGGVVIEDGGVDGGSVSDGGSVNDGGSVSDAGSLEIDGGVTNDAGDPSRRVGVVQCGCGAGGPALGWILIAAVARRRRARSG